jgi:methionine aminotransferase
MPSATPTPAGKLPDVGTTIFTIMSALAAEHGALNLAQGFPDFPPPAALLGHAAAALQAGPNQYAPMAGLPELRERIATQVTALYGHHADPEHEVTITSGATSALFCAIEALVDHGDEVILLDPAYDSYDPAVRLAGGTPVHVPLRIPGFGIDWQRVREAVTPRTRMLVLNSPHNPTGAMLGEADIAALRELVQSTGILLLSDEVYEHIIFDGREHLGLLRYPELAARSLVVSSFGKTLHATGWKIGYCVAPRPLMAPFRRVHQFVQFCVAAPLQAAIARFMADEPGHGQTLAAFYQRKRDLFCSLLAGSRFSFEPAAGTYFQLLDYSAISVEPDLALARRLTREAGIAAIPVSPFCAQRPGDMRLLRFCFAKDDATLRRAAEILCAI